MESSFYPDGVCYLIVIVSGKRTKGPPPFGSYFRNHSGIILGFGCHVGGHFQSAGPARSNLARQAQLN